MKTLAAFTLLALISGHTLAQESFSPIYIEQDESKYMGYIYQQQEYQLEDPHGDVLLLWTAHQIPKFVWKNLQGKDQELLRIREAKLKELILKYPQYAPKEEALNVVVDDYIPFNLEDEAITLEGHKAPFKIKNVAHMFKQVITEEYKSGGITPLAGEVHEWSPEIKNEIHKKFPVFSRMSKLLIALSRGATSHYMVTGTEDELASYILTRPNNSVNLEEMFRTSYRMNNGDVYLTLLTIENLLSRFWYKPKRSKRAITTKLKDITNFHYSTDKFGSWYHLFGIMLYGYAEGSFKSRAVGNIESLGSSIMGRFADERQEKFINARGGPIGGKLRRFMRRKEYETFELDSRYLSEDFYMDLDEDFSKRLKRKQKKS